MEGLLQANTELSRQVIANDSEIDQLNDEIDRESERYIALRAPKASDMRLVLVAINAGHNLERVGDEATTIARRSLRLHESDQPLRNYHDLEKMSSMAMNMLDDALRCYTEEVPDLPLDIIRRDREVDKLNRSNYNAFSEEISNNPAILGSALECIFISKSLERIADHAKNLAEEVTYLISGKTLKSHEEETPRREPE